MQVRRRKKQMSKRILMVLVIAAAALWVSAAFAAPNMQPGKWEITMKMEMKDMPMEMPPVKASVCLTDNDMVPQKAEKNQDCKMISNKI
jgi:predicted metal-binding membrane protein